MIVKMVVEKQMESRLARETEVIGENLPQRHFCPSQNPTSRDQGFNPGRRGGKPATNRLSYGAALRQRHFVHHKSHLTRPGFEKRYLFAYILRGTNRI
jgi:hypothetical protein